MNRTATVILAALLVGACTLQAQDANPLSKNMKDSWTNIRDLLSKMAQTMPDENYRFKATPDVQDFGQRMAHAVSFIMRGCATVKGEQKTVNFSAAPTKAEVLAAMKDADAECDGVFNSLTDADAMQMMSAGRGGQRLKQAMLQSMVLEHSQEMYGYMAVYLRLKGLVPPSSDRNER
jgi:outer membrane PBP1 activator LpoA protein